MILLQACDDPFQPHWRTLARLDLGRGRVEPVVDFPMFPQLCEWITEGMIVLEEGGGDVGAFVGGGMVDEADPMGVPEPREVRAVRLLPSHPRFREVLERRLGFTMRLVDPSSADR